MELVDTPEFCKELRDPLTGLYSRDTLRERLEWEYNRSRELNLPLSLVSLDLDGFGAINQKLFLPAGDRILVEVAHLLASETRSSDLLARDGGDQFTVIMRETDCDVAYSEAERIRVAIASGKWEFPITASLGVATLTPRHATAWELFESARQALHKAKVLGRNQVAVNSNT